MLVTTLTKRMAEELTDYYGEHGVRVRYLHSDIETIERTEIIRELREGGFDVLVGINLLREGLDIPEVSLVAILDADKEGFLRSTRSLIQTIGRAARNVNGTVILYADQETTRSARRSPRRTAAARSRSATTPSTASRRAAWSSGSRSLRDSIWEADYVTVPTRARAPPEPRFRSHELARAASPACAARCEAAAKALEFERAAALRDRIRGARGRSRARASWDAPNVDASHERGSKRCPASPASTCSRTRGAR